MTNLMTDLIFPTFYTVIGAIIGGWFAYKIAKASFMLDRLNQGNECIELIKIRADHIKEKSEKLCTHLRRHTTCENERDSSTFLDNLFTSTTLLETDISSFLSYIECHGDTIFLCSTKRICRNQKKREQYEAFGKAITDILPEIATYQLLVKKYTKMHYEATKTESPKVTLHTFLKNNESTDILNQAVITLNELKTRCSDIQNSYKVLNT